MKSVRLILFLLIAGMPVLWSCNKDSDPIEPVRIIQLNEDVRVNDLMVINDSVWIACGGRRNEKGFIWRSSDGGVSWSKWTVPEASSVYCVARASDGTCWAGGDFLRLWKSTDNGQSWEFQWLGAQVPVHEEDRPAVRDIEFGADSSWYFCGGENLGEGVVYCSENNGLNWDFRFFQHEMRAVHVGGDGLALAGGHGLLLRSEDGLDALDELIWENDFISSMTALNDHTIIASGLQGGVFVSRDKGLSWEHTLRGGRIGKTQGFFDVESRGTYALAVGYKGVLQRSDDSGNSWSRKELADNPDLFSVAIISDSQSALTSDNGIIYIIDTP